MHRGSWVGQKAEFSQFFRRGKSILKTIMDTCTTYHSTRFFTYNSVFLLLAADLIILSMKNWVKGSGAPHRPHPTEFIWFWQVHRPLLNLHSTCLTYLDVRYWESNSYRLLTDHIQLILINSSGQWASCNMQWISQCPSCGPYFGDTRWYKEQVGCGVLCVKMTLS